MNELLLPVSMGEALDKLTILDIKRTKITDSRRVDVIKEYDILNATLGQYKQKFFFHYNILSSINERIWNILDDINSSECIEEKCGLCIQIISENDNRYRIKRKINNISNSTLKEQKNYSPNKAFVLTHLGLGDNIVCIGAVRYLATRYDKVIVVCKKQHTHNMNIFYNDDDTIELYPVENDHCISPRLGFDFNEFQQITRGMDVYLSGCHCLDGNHNAYTDLPFNFYKDMGIDTKCCRDYFHVNTPDEAHILQNKLKDVKEFIFIHNTASNGIIFSIEEMEKQFNFDKQNVLIINPNYNVYKEADNHHNLAEQFLNHPLAFYSQIIINCDKLIVTDSSFFALSLFLPIKTSECYYKSRNNINYSHISNETKFIQLT
tara:strand:+ start:953 stop:2083 length:1131 start_codon:yes stop_codon:yes gene_type:complete